MEPAPAVFQILILLSEFTNIVPALFPRVILLFPLDHPLLYPIPMLYVPVVFWFNVHQPAPILYEPEILDHKELVQSAVFPTPEVFTSRAI